MTSLEVDRIEWMRIYTVTCPACESPGGWRLWTKGRPQWGDDPDAGLVCLGCDLEWTHPLVYPAYIEARAARIAEGTDGDWPPLELPPRDEDEDDGGDTEEGIGWRPHSKGALVDIYESDAVAAEYWSVLDDRSRWDVDWPDLWEAEGLVRGIDRDLSQRWGVDEFEARRRWQDSPDLVATARAKLAELVGDRRNRAQFYHGSTGLLAQLRAVQDRIDAKNTASPGTGDQPPQAG